MYLLYINEQAGPIPYFAGNAISVIEEGAFEGLDELETLHLDANRIPEFDSSMLDSVPNLKVLTLSHNNLKSLSVFPNVSMDWF